MPVVEKTSDGCLDHNSIVEFLAQRSPGYVVASPRVREVGAGGPIRHNRVAVGRDRAVEGKVVADCMLVAGDRVGLESKRAGVAPVARSLYSRARAVSAAVLQSTGAHNTDLAAGQGPMFAENTPDMVARWVGALLQAIGHGRSPISQDPPLLREDRLHWLPADCAP